MKVKMLRNPSDALGCELKEGEIGEVAGDVGRNLVQRGVAVELEQPKPKEEPKPIKAVPSKPAVAEASESKITQTKPAAKPAAKQSKKETD